LKTYFIPCKNGLVVEITNLRCIFFSPVLFGQPKNWLK
jgi:hypothetical protein